MDKKKIKKMSVVADDIVLLTRWFMNFMYVYTFVSFQCFFLGFLYSALGVDGRNTDDIVYPTIDDILYTSEVVVQDFFQQSAPPLVLS